MRLPNRGAEGKDLRPLLEVVVLPIRRLRANAAKESLRPAAAPSNLPLLPPDREVPSIILLPHYSSGVPAPLCLPPSVDPCRTDAGYRAPGGDCPAQDRRFEDQPRDRGRYKRQETGTKRQEHS